MQPASARTGLVAMAARHDIALTPFDYLGCIGEQPNEKKSRSSPIQGQRLAAGSLGCSGGGVLERAVQLVRNEAADAQDAQAVQATRRPRTMMCTQDNKAKKTFAIAERDLPLVRNHDARGSSSGYP